MPRVPVHDVDSVPKASRDLLAALKDRYGKVLNIYGEMAHAPVVLAAYGASRRPSRNTAASTPVPGRRLPWPSPTPTAAATAGPRTPPAGSAPG
jgi:hypothetical protein